MSTKHVVKNGETLSQIAFDFGFQNWELIWNDDANRSLRDKRGKPELIQAGDELVIPDKKPKTEKVGAGKFQLAKPPPLAAFSLKVSDRKGDAFQKLTVELRMPGAGTSKTFVTDKDGLVQINDPSITEGEIEVVNLIDKTADPEISYSDFRPDPLAVGKAHTLTLPNKRKVADRIAALAGVGRRASWGASKPKKQLEPDWDYDVAVVHHSGDGGERSPKNLQNKHFSTGYDDIAYEYVVTLEGNIFEGRHLAFKSAGNSEHNTKKIAIIVAGDFEHQWWDDDDDPTPAAMAALVKLVNAIKTEFPIGKLVGHRDLPRAKGATECPGEELYKLLGDVRTQTGLGGP